MIHFWGSFSDLETYKEVLDPPLSQYPGETKMHVLKDLPPNVPPGELVFAMGAKPMKILQTLKYCPGNLGMGRLRQQIWEGEGTPFLLSYDPGVTKVDLARLPEIHWDVNLAIRYATHGSLDPILGKYTYTDDFEYLYTAVKKRIEAGERVDLTCDLETVGLDPFNLDAYIVSIAFSIKEGTGMVTHFKSKVEYPRRGSQMWSRLKWLLTCQNIRVIGANFKFDWVWIAHHFGIECTNFGLDTLLIGSLLDENRQNSLEMHTKIFAPDLGGYDAHLNRTYDKGRMDLVPKEDLLPYAAGDVDSCLRVSGVLRKQLMQDKKLARFYVYLVHRSARAFCRMEYQGMEVDRDAYEDLKIQLENDIETIHADAIAMLPANIRHKFADNLKLSRAVVINEYMFTANGLNLKPKMTTEKTLAPSITKNHLQMFAKHPKAGPFISKYLEWTSLRKTLSTYVVGFLKHLRSDGKFHPTYMLHRGEYKGGDTGAVTGRSSAKDPAYQTIPKHTSHAAALRRVYIAPEGHEVMDIDYSAGELRIAADIANEKTMLGVFLSGGDIHLETGLAMYNMQHPDEQLTLEEAKILKAKQDPRIKKARQGGKAGNFGLIYGMQAKGFVDYAWYGYGVQITLDQAHEFRDFFFDKYPGLVAWHKRSVETARAQGFVRSPLGRIRHLPLINSYDWKVSSQAERQAINSPVQATLSDMCQLAIATLSENHPELRIFGFTHDAISFYTPKDERQYWATTISTTMENLPLKKLFGWDPKLKFEVEVEVGPNLADLEEYTLAA